LISYEWETAQFKTNVLIKNIIGKELINDDNVAVMELVKNSYDAGASRVDIEFKNIFNGESTLVDIEGTLNKISQIIIKDDGRGMSEEDIINKWLNIAYSSKKIETTQNERLQAGNKGVGRFSCDRLGSFLNIYTKKKNLDIVHLQINWKDFELLDEINIQIQDIPIKIRNIKDTEFKKKSGFDIFDEGTILQIIQLNTVWAELEEDNLFPKVNKSRLLKLKNSLERLINPNQSFDQKSFNIYLKAIELLEDTNISYHEKFNGKIINQIFDKLDFKTTFIESFITDDGTKIITELKDKNKIIFRVIEKNNEFPLLKDIKITLYYLNPYAKAYFKKQTGVRSVSFGSVFLFINGFRISPYGDTDNDWLGLEQRKSQGVRRNLSGREMLGRIELKDLNGQYRIVSSREGIVHNDLYKQLVSDFGKSKHSKYNGFYYKIHRRLEKYVVDGLDWDSADTDETDIERLVEEESWNESQEKYLSTNQSKLNNSSNVIYSILGIKSKDVLDLYINEDLIESLIEEDTEKTNEKLQTFLKKYTTLSPDTLDDKTKLAISKLSKNIEDKELSNQFKEAVKAKRKVQEELKEEKKSQKELYKQFKKKNIEIIREAKKEKEELKEELNKTKEELTQKKKHNAFQGSILGTEKKYIMGLQHQVRHSSSRILTNLQLFLENLDSSKLTNDEKSFLNVISMESSKILSIANFITKADYDLKTNDEANDIVNFINHYINEIYINDSKLIDTDLEKIDVVTNNIEYVSEYVPLDITTIIDNFITNAENANAKNLVFIFIKTNDELFIEISDDGHGISSDIINDIFDFGYTTTDGSGIGLYNIKTTVENMNGIIEVKSNGTNQTTFLIRLKNEIKL